MHFLTFGKQYFNENGRSGVDSMGEMSVASIILYYSRRFFELLLNPAR